MTIDIEDNTSKTTNKRCIAPSDCTKEDSEPKTPSSRPATTMPLLPITSPSTIRLCKSLPLRPSDVFICSYPKSGTTWTQHIVLSLILADREARSVDDSMEIRHVSDFAPFFEIDAHWDNTNRTLASSVIKNHEKLRRRVFNTHLWWDMLPKGDDDSKNCGKFIYVVRSGLDACVSFYHHLSNQVEGGYEKPFEEFFEDWIHGKIAFGSYLDHLSSFANAFAEDVGTDTSTKCLLLLSYESMVKNLSAVVRDIISFLNLRHISESQVEVLLPTFSFEAMKTNIHLFQPRSVNWKERPNGERFCFLRNGKVGDSKTLVDDSQRELFQEWVQEEEYVRKITSVLGRRDPLALEIFLKLVES